MTVLVDKTSELGRSLKITIPNQEMQQAYNKRFNEFSKEAHIKGFRPGKVPTKILKQRYGKSIEAEVADSLIQSSFSEALEKNALKPIQQPEVNLIKFDFKEDLEFEAKFEIYPEFEIKSFDDVTLTEYKLKPKAKELKDFEQKVRTEFAQKLEDIDRAIKAKDIVNIKYDVEFADSPENNMSEQSQQVEINGEDQILPGLTKKLTGAKVGDKLELSGSFPDDWAQDVLKNKSFKANIEILAAQQSVPANDQEYFQWLKDMLTAAISQGKLEAKDYPEFANDKSDDINGDDDLEQEKTESEINVPEAAKLQEYLTQVMQLDIANDFNELLKEEALKALKERNKINLPQSLIDQEKKRVEHEYSHQQDLPANFIEENADKILEEATDRVQLGILLNKLVEVNNIKVDQEDLINKIKKEMPWMLYNPQAFEMLKKNPQIVENLKRSIVVDKAIAEICKQCKLEEKEISLDEFNKLAEQEAS